MAKGQENRGDITSLLDRWVAGEPEVLPELAPALYPQWRRLTVSGILAENTLLKAQSKLSIPRHRSLAPSFVLVGRRRMASP